MFLKERTIVSDRELFATPTWSVNEPTIRKRSLTLRRRLQRERSSCRTRCLIFQSSSRPERGGVHRRSSCPNLHVLHHFCFSCRHRHRVESTMTERIEEPPTSEPSIATAAAEELADYDNDFDVVDTWTAADFVSENDFDMIDMLSAALEQITLQLNEKQREFRARSTEWTSKTREKIRMQTQRLEARRVFLEARLQKHYRSIYNRMNRDEKTVQLRDKLSFVVGVGNACVTPALTARLPTWIPIYYTVQCLYLLSLRYLIYKVRNWHYFIFDLCYFVNAMTLLFLWCFPSSSALFFATFCLTNGPVAWAIITWQVIF